MKYIRSRSLKRLFSIGRRSTSSTEDSGIAEETEEEKENNIQQNNNNNNNNNNINNVQFSNLDFVDSTIIFSKKPSFKCFSFEQVFSATNGFSPENMVGKGGYSEVYRGEIGGGEMAVAVKRLTKTSKEERGEREFLTEIGTIGHVCHPNVSSLLGCCLDNGLYLVFPFSSRGSLASLLHDKSIPTMEWEVRQKVAIGIAKGLHYLHKGCQRRIIHRDIKATNILINEDFEPQISDFGLAIWLPTQWTHHSIAPIEGTVGYLAPEYFSHGIVDEKTDVFAFGVVLLELITGRKPVDSSHQSLRSWAKPFLKRGEIERLVDPRLEDVFDELEIRRLAFTASLCIRSAPTWRPTMSEVLEMMMGGEIDEERWEMPEKETINNQEEYLDFEDLEYECDSSFSTSMHDSHSTGSS